MSIRLAFLPALALAAAASLPQAANAQGALTGSSVTFSYLSNPANCAFREGQVVVADGGATMRVSLVNPGPGNRQFYLSVELRPAGGAARSLRLGSELSAGPNQTSTFVFSQVSPALPTNLTNGTALLTISDCRAARQPMANM